MSNFAFPLGTVINGNTITAQPTGTGNYGGMYQLTRPDSTTYYDYLSVTQGLTEFFNIGFDGDQINNTNPLPVNVSANGVGKFAAVPTGGNTTTPVVISTRPANAIGVELYLPSSSSINANVASTSSDAAAQISASVAPVYDNASLGKIVKINIGVLLNLYVSGVSGSPLFRWM